MTRSLPLFALALLVGLALGSVLAAGVVSLVRRRVLACEPVTRHRALLLLALLPLLLGLTLTLSASLPPLVSLVIPAVDHCDLHDDDHAHLCFVHAPRSISPLASALLVVVAAISAWRAIKAGLRLRRARRLLRALVASGENSSVPSVSVIESSLPICIAAGLFRPRILVARGLLAGLDTEQREIVLSHERAHVLRRDALAAAIVRGASLLHLPWIRRWLVDELGVAAEQACDEVAARQVDDRDAVAAAILAVQRAWLRCGTSAVAALGPGFATDALERRVRSLLADPLPPRSFVVPALCLLAVVGTTLAAADALHHAAESAISHLTE